MSGCPHAPAAPLPTAVIEVVKFSDEVEVIPSRVFHELGDLAVELQVIYGREELQMLLGRHLIARNLEPWKIAAERKCSDPAMSSML